MWSLCRQREALGLQSLWTREGTSCAPLAARVSDPIQTVSSLPFYGACLLYPQLSPLCVLVEARQPRLLRTRWGRTESVALTFHSPGIWSSASPAAGAQLPWDTACGFGCQHGTDSAFWKGGGEASGPRRPIPQATPDLHTGAACSRQAHLRTCCLGQGTCTGGKKERGAESACGFSPGCGTESSRHASFLPV